MKSILLVKKLLGLVEMMSGLVNASFSLPEWQAVKMIFFAPWICFIFPTKLYSNSLFPFANDIYCSKFSSASKGYLSKLHLISLCPEHSC